MVLLPKKYTFPRIQSGSNILQGGGGGSTFSSWRGGGGVQMLITIETHITCNFPGGGDTLPPPPSLDPHMILMTNGSLINEGQKYC